ncbi:MAG: FAD:protein FMN transferase [Treponematales bacterium]
MSLHAASSACRLPLAAVLLFSFSSCAQSARQPERTEFMLGTFCTISLFEKGTDAIYNNVFGRLRELEDIFSANRDDSVLAAVNRAAGIAPVKARQELIEALEKALAVAHLSGGAFDPTVGPLVQLWDIGGGSPRVPDESEIRERLSLVNFRDVEIDREAGTVFLRRRGMALDLGGIAKGFAADEAAETLRGSGVVSAVIDLGGNILVLGERLERRRSLFGGTAGGRPWRVGVQDPREGRGAYLGVIETRGRSVVTSGVYERFFERDGVRYHHILSTAAGRPVDNGLLSVTVAADKSVDADALSTAVFALGPEKGRALLAAFPGAEAVFVFEDNSVGVTAGLEASFSLIPGTYHLGFP